MPLLRPLLIAAEPGLPQATCLQTRDDQRRLRQLPVKQQEIAG